MTTIYIFGCIIPLNIQETSRDKIIRTAQQEREIRLSLWPSCVCSEALFPSAPERSSRDYTRTLSSPVWYRLLDTQNTLQRAQMVQRSRHKYRSAIYANGNYKYIYINVMYANGKSLRTIEFKYK